MTYVAVTKFYFWKKFSKFWIENPHNNIPKAIGRHRGSKRRSKSCFWAPKSDQGYIQKYQKVGQENPNKDLGCIWLCRLSSDFVLKTAWPVVAGPKLAITVPRQGPKHFEMMNSLVQKSQNLISLTLWFLHLMIIPFTLNLKNDLVIASYFFNCVQWDYWRTHDEKKVCI